MNEHKRRKQVNGQWPCRVCKEYKDQSAFGRISAAWNGLDTACKECRSHKRKTPNERELIWEFCIKKHYGLTKEAFNELLIEQNGVCAICFKSNSAGRRLNVDHCHATGRVRGLLCANCNTALGLLGDNAEIFVNAINYLNNSN